MNLKASLELAKINAERSVADKNLKRLELLVLRHNVLTILKKPIPSELVKEIEDYYKSAL